MVIDHNTAIHIGNIITAEGPPHRGFVFTANIVAHNTYGTDKSPLRRAVVDGTDVRVDDNALMRSTRPGGDGRR